jgi:hypothetical protein
VVWAPTGPTARMMAPKTQTSTRAFMAASPCKSTHVRHFTSGGRSLPVAVQRLPAPVR